MGCLKLTNYKQKLPRQWTLLCQKIKTTKHPFIQESSASNDVLKEFVWDPTAGEATRPLYMKIPQEDINLFYLHDANKNVTEVAYLATTNGIGAHYEYDSFGNTITSTRNTRISSPDLRTYNPFRFSSEYHDDELSLIYYNYRHYNPTSGRWISRDPIAEEGGNNLYDFVKNNSIKYIDVLGLFSFDLFALENFSVKNKSDGMEEEQTNAKNNLNLLIEEFEKLAKESGCCGLAKALKYWKGINEANSKITGAIDDYNQAAAFLEKAMVGVRYVIDNGETPSETFYTELTLLMPNDLTIHRTVNEIRKKNRRLQNALRVLKEKQDMDKCKTK